MRSRAFSSCELPLSGEELAAAREEAADREEEEGFRLAYLVTTICRQIHRAPWHVTMHAWINSDRCRARTSPRLQPDLHLYRGGWEVSFKHRSSRTLSPFLLLPTSEPSASIRALCRFVPPLSSLFSSTRSRFLLFLFFFPLSYSLSLALRLFYFDASRRTVFHAPLVTRAGIYCAWSSSGRLVTRTREGLPRGRSLLTLLREDTEGACVVLNTGRLFGWWRRRRWIGYEEIVTSYSNSFSNYSRRVKI